MNDRTGMRKVAWRLLDIDRIWIAYRRRMVCGMQSAHSCAIPSRKCTIPHRRPENRARAWLDAQIRTRSDVRCGDICSDVRWRLTAARTPLNIAHGQAQLHTPWYT